MRVKSGSGQNRLFLGFSQLDTFYQQNNYSLVKAFKRDMVTHVVFANYNMYTQKNEKLVILRWNIFSNELKNSPHTCAQSNIFLKLKNYFQLFYLRSSAASRSGSSLAGSLIPWVCTVAVQILLNSTSTSNQRPSSSCQGSEQLNSWGNLGPRSKVVTVTLSKYCEI